MGENVIKGRSLLIRTCCSFDLNKISIIESNVGTNYQNIEMFKCIKLVMFNFVEIN